MLTFKDLKKLSKQPCEDRKVVRIALLGDTATQFLATAVRGWMAERGMFAELWEAEYSQIDRQLLDLSSEYYQQTFNYTIIYRSSHKWLEHHSALQDEQREGMADAEIDFLDAVCSQAKGRIIYCNMAEIDDGVFGNYAAKVRSSAIYQQRLLNLKLMDVAAQHGNLSICDLNSIQAKVGRDAMFDASIYTSTEMILSVDAVCLVAKSLTDIIAAAEGKFKKCLILDLDNTLWGGVIGDDGMEGIQLGHGMGIGKNYTELQMWVKKLRQRGIIIAVCSKNDEAVAKEPFEKHPDMVLRLDDISVFVANWDTKVDNIRFIQQVLNIGFDSMVFLDDNPFERNIVRENIEGITVPELPEDSADYLEFLYSLNLFETASYSSGDKDRTKQYQVEAQRASVAKTFANEADFLKSLNMVSLVSEFNSFNTPRVAQLSQRSNQFNLRTVRYSEEDIRQIAEDNSSVGLAFTLEDKFGDNGLICVIVMRQTSDEELFIESWFMSCRVLKRGMENFTLNTIVEKARRRGIKRIIGEYLPTAKNGMVEKHYTNLGFKSLESETAKYILEVKEYENRECYINLKDES